MANPPPTGGSAGVNSFTGPAGSLDSGLDRTKAKKTGKHENKDVTTTEGQSLVGRSSELGTSQPVARKILDRNARSYDQLDHAGLVLPSSGSDEGDIDMDAMLDQQMRDKFGDQPVSKPPASRPTGDSGTPSASDSTTPPSSQPPSGDSTTPVPPPVTDKSTPATPTASANVQIQTTEEVEDEAQKIEQTEKGLSKKLKFLDKYGRHIGFYGGWSRFVRSWFRDFSSRVDYCCNRDDVYCDVSGLSFARC